MIGISDPRQKALYHNVSRQTVFWRCLLYILNGLMLALSVTLFGLTIYIKNSREYEVTTAPMWIIHTTIAFSVIATVIAVVGIVGTYQSPRYIVDNSCNFWMFFYQLCMIACFIVTLIAGLAFFALIKQLKDLGEDGTKLTGNALVLEEKMVDWMKLNDEKWISVQNYFNCCSYGKIDDQTLSTGQLCVDHREDINNGDFQPGTCKELLIDKLEDKSYLVGVFAVVVASFQIVALLSSCCVLWKKPRRRRAPLASLGE